MDTLKDIKKHIDYAVLDIKNGDPKLFYCWLFPNFFNKQQVQYLSSFIEKEFDLVNIDYNVEKTDTSIYIYPKGEGTNG